MTAPGPRTGDDTYNLIDDALGQPHDLGSGAVPVDVLVYQDRR